MTPCPTKKDIYKYNLFICSGDDVEKPIITPPMVKEDMTDKMTIANTDPMLITLFMIFSLHYILNLEITSSVFDIEKMIYICIEMYYYENKSCFDY